MDDILRDIPDSFDTERLLIRMPMQGDGRTVWEAKQASKASLAESLPNIPLDDTVEESEAEVRRASLRYQERSDFRLFLFRKEDGVFIGSSGLHRVDWDVPKVEIGYWIDERYSGNGYMTEAVAGVTAFAEEAFGAKRIEIRCDPLDAKGEKMYDKNKDKSFLTIVYPLRMLGSYGSASNIDA
ncbi:GNAT family N-acetyltransferase [Alkalicoccus chagannorensis]|uniref:GNAT family N-acetyltransferase n=1 Tax=Alkalicoccus chagannorensis TaxID=427072 RepID=UPI00041298B0|nr:GNAT family N-acetyltransferase [Alkalicoccus chagannorensis]